MTDLICKGRLSKVKIIDWKEEGYTNLLPYCQFTGSEKITSEIRLCTYFLFKLSGIRMLMEIVKFKPKMNWEKPQINSFIKGVIQVKFKKK
jgi:hypothetical protein